MILQDKAKENHLVLFVWNRKELENYCLCIPAILRISKLSEDRHAEFLQQIEDEINSLYDSIIEAFTNEFYLLEPQRGAGYASTRARRYVELKWLDLEAKFGMVNGKIAIGCVNRILQQYCKRSCSTNKLISEIDPSEIDPQVSHLFSMVIDNRS